jgi:phosphate transport system substrate-binding protein
VTEGRHDAQASLMTSNQALKGGKMSGHRSRLRRLGRWRRVAAAGALAAAAILVGVAPGSAPASPKSTPTITMSGSTTVAPLAALLARKYIQSHNVQFRIAQGGSNVGISDVAHGRVSIGNSSRDPQPGDPGGLIFHKIAKDAICVITNKANTLPNLDQSGVQAIFDGDVRHWSDVPGASRGSHTIDLFVRTAASGTHDAFQKIFMDPKQVDNAVAKQLSSNGLVQQKVKGDKDGIGYVSLFFAKGTHPVAYKGVACNLRNAKSGQYGGLRNLYMVTRGNNPAVAIKFIHWVQNSRAAKKIVATQWVPIH